MVKQLSTARIGSESIFSRKEQYFEEKGKDRTIHNQVILEENGLDGIENYGNNLMVLKSPKINNKVLSPLNNHPKPNKSNSDSVKKV